MRDLGEPVVAGRTAFVVVVVVFVVAVGLMLLGGEHLRLAGGQALTASLLGGLATLLMQVNAAERARTERLHEAERTNLARQVEHAFTVGSASHWANVTFDKHVKFCEDYAAELGNALKTLLLHAATGKALAHAAALAQLRHRQALWLTSEIDARLEQVEVALRKIGTKDLQIKGAQTQEELNMINKEQVQHLFDLFGEEVLGGVPDGMNLDQDLAIGRVVRWLGSILGVPDLLRLRNHILGSTSTRSDH